MIYLLKKKDTGETISCWRYVYKEGCDDLYYFVEPTELWIGKTRLTFEIENNKYVLPNNYWLVKDGFEWYIVASSWINHNTNWQQVRKEINI